MFQLIQSYYYYLSLGKFFEALSQSNDLSLLSLDLPIDTGKNSYFKIKGSLLKKLLLEIHQHPNQRNIFGYLTEISAFKGIFSVMRELIEESLAFRNFLQGQLKDQYFPFEQLIRFLRNVLSHASSSGVLLKGDDFEKQLEYLLSNKINNPIVDFNFTYHQYILQWKGSKEYGMHMVIDFKKLQSGMKLESIIDWHQLYLLSELCFNLAQIAEFSFKKQSKPQKQIKTFGPKVSPSPKPNRASQKPLKSHTLSKQKQSNRFSKNDRVSGKGSINNYN